MVKFETFAAWLCTSMGLALVGLSILVVPADAFADYSGNPCSWCRTELDPGKCASTCCLPYSGDDRSACCADACGANTDCLSACCGGDSACIAKSTLLSGQCPDGPVMGCKKLKTPCDLPLKVGACVGSTNMSQCDCQ